MKQASLLTENAFNFPDVQAQMSYFAVSVLCCQKLLSIMRKSGFLPHLKPDCASENLWLMCNSVLNVQKYNPGKVTISTTPQISFQSFTLSGKCLSFVNYFNHVLSPSLITNDTGTSGV